MEKVLEAEKSTSTTGANFDLMNKHWRIDMNLDVYIRSVPVSLKQLLSFDVSGSNERMKARHKRR